MPVCVSVSSCGCDVNQSLLFMLFDDLDLLVFLTLLAFFFSSVDKYKVQCLLRWPFDLLIKLGVFALLYIISCCEIMGFVLITE
jgi:hypothetical protein